MDLTARSVWAGRRRLTLEPAGRALAALAASMAIGALVTGREPLVGGALALGLLVALDAVSAWRGLPPDPVDVRAADGTAGTASEHTLRLVPTRRAVLVRRAGDAPVRLRAGTTEASAGLALPARGLHREERLTVTAAGPLHLVTVRRAQRTTHEPTLAAGPVPVAHDLRWPPLAALTAIGQRRAARGEDLFRGVRPYRAGDLRRSVHWPATARTGSLMVREREGVGPPTVRLAVGYATPGPAAEAALGRAAWAAEQACKSGWDVILVTCEGDPAQVVEAPVREPGEVIRRLAAAVPGPLPVRPGSVTTRWITPTGDRWS